MKDKIAKTKDFVARNKTSIIIATTAGTLIVPLTWLAVMGMKANMRTMDFVSDNDLYEEWNTYLRA